MRIPPQWTARVGSLMLVLSGLFVIICLLSYAPSDSILLSFPPQSPVENWGGTVGAWLGLLGRGGFGWASFLLPLLSALWAWRLWRAGASDFHGFSVILGSLCLLSSAATLLAMVGVSKTFQADLGGAVGFLLADSGRYYLGAVGTFLAAIAAGLLSWLVVLGQTLQNSGLGALYRWATAALSFGRPTAAVTGLGRAAVMRPKTQPSSADRTDSAESGEDSQPAATGILARVRIRSTVEQKPKSIPTPPRRQTPGGFQLPSLDLLLNPPPLSERQVSEDLQMNARMLEETLREFGIEATVDNIDRGPTVTRYEVNPAPGVKLTKIVSLADDIALVMKAASCHIVAPIPGKGRVGIDVPNSITTIVYLKEIITSHEFAGNASAIALPVGKDVSGHAIVTDLRECPHLLIAGATGSGKTVCLNSVLIGIMMRSSPEQVKFLMIDPKMVEMALFNEIPHLIAPVVTNAKKVAMALNWAVEEMERRYQLLARAGVRNIDMYNKRLAAQGPMPKKPEPPPSDDPNAEIDEGPADDGRPLPYIVIVVDELADLMMVAAQDIEGAIARLAQLSRAVGIHMILATQRPSVDVITGVIKANFPARIAFQVASKVDSRTILDTNGADKLLGRGDLLFLKPGAAKPIRAQGALVTDAEIEAVTTFLKQQRQPCYDERLLEKARQPGNSISLEKDEMYEAARQLVLDTGQASTSLLQRRLRLGYGRAARILDIMEQEGLVGPPQGSRPREVLVSRDTAQRGSSS